MAQVIGLTAQKIEETYIQSTNFREFKIVTAAEYAALELAGTVDPDVLYAKVP